MKKFWWLAAATTLVVTSFSMFGPVLAVLLQQRGMGTAAVGAFAMIPFACVALLIPIMPRIFARYGIGRVYVLGMVLESACTLGYIAFFDSPHAFAGWCASAVAGGIGAAAVWNATEALLAENAPPDKRGQVMGLYQTALGAALAIGPFVPALLGWQAKTTLIAAVIVQFAALAIALQLKLTQAAHTLVHPEDSRQIGSTWQAVRLVPALVLIAFAGGVFEAGLSSVSAAHGAALGLSLAQASALVGALGVGSFAFQYPAGLAADRFAPRSVFGIAAAALLIASIAFAASPQYTWLLYATAVVWGGVGGALYTLTMIRVAHHFNASMGASAVASGTAAMITGYTMGGALGPLISGSALQYLGAWGLSLWLSVLSVAVFIASLRTGQMHQNDQSPA